MAAQAGVERLSRRHQGERAGDGGFASAGCDVITAGAMTTFAAGLIFRLFPGGDGFEVGVFIEVEPDIGVAGFADLAAHKFVGRLRYSHDGQCNQNKDCPKQHSL